MADNTVRGRFVWHELITPNGAGAHEFYGKTLGWTRQGWEHDASYQMFAAANGPFGATIERRDAVPHWLPYVGVTDVDATVDAAMRLGATVTTPATELPNAGRFAVLADPQGAEFGVHGSPGEPRPEPPVTYGDFSWHELATNATVDEAFGFYSELFGWDKVDTYDMGPAGAYLLFGRNGQRLGGMFKKGDTGKPGPAYWVGYVRVKDVDRTVEAMKDARAAVLNGPMEVPGGDRIAQLADPHGAFFAVHMLAADARKPAARVEPAAAKPAQPARAAKPTKAAKPAEAAKAAPKKAAKKKSAKKSAKKAGKKAGKKAAKKAPKKKAPTKKAKKKAKRVAKRAQSKKPSNKAKKKSAKKGAKKRPRK
jgi:predicted enzyme related to lactoylglutathione lyase